MTIIRPSERQLQRIAIDGMFKPLTAGHQNLYERVLRIERERKAGRISADTAVQRLDEEAKKVTRLRKAPLLAWTDESADRLDMEIGRVMRKVGDPLTALSTGQITADEARRRGVNVR